MQPKTFYTYAELSKMNSQRLISTYNRIFNTNAWELFFNPFEHRTDMLLELMDEMRLQKALSLLAPMDGPVEKYKAMKIAVSPEGFAVLWNVGVKAGNRKVSDEQMTLIRDLHADGETMRWIAGALNLSTKVVFEVLSGRYATTANRWNTATETPDQVKPMRKAAQTFKGATRKINYQAFVTETRPANDFWAGLGL